MALSLGTSQIGAHWWIPLLRGIVAIAFGIAIFLYPLSAVAAFVFLFGAYAFVDGVLNIVTALRFAHPSSGGWWMILVQGILGIAIGVLTFVLPGLTAATLGLLIAIWAVATGVLEIIAGVRLRRSVSGEFFLILSGVLSVIVGLWLFAAPLAALFAVTWLIGIYAVIAGIALIALAFRLRSHRGPAIA